MATTTLDCVRGCLLGAALGDAFGAPFEFASAGDAAWRMGGQLISDLREAAAKPSPHGYWSDDPPAGTGTDGTRYTWLFAELAAELGHMPTATELAERYLAVYESPELFFPTHPDLAKQQFAALEGVCRGHLGQPSQEHPDVPVEVLRERSIGLNFPTLLGLITLAPAGLLFCGEPEDAYRAVWLTDFYDIGYAREATAMFAAAIALASAGDTSAKRVLFKVEELDPFDLGGPFGQPRVKDQLLGRCNGIDVRQPDSQVAKDLSIALRDFHPFDPLRALITAFVANLACEGDPIRAIRIAANIRAVKGRDNLAEFLDIDSYALIAGALAGALFGAEAVPEGMLGQVVEADEGQYGMDLEAAAARLATASAAS